MQPDRENMQTHARSNPSPYKPFYFCSMKYAMLHSNTANYIFKKYTHFLENERISDLLMVLFEKEFDFPNICLLKSDKV